MRRPVALVMALLPGLVLPGLALAGPWDGIYRQAANADCALVGVDGGALQIADGIFFGVESQCFMTRPVDVVDMQATLYTMECVGAGSSWVDRAMVMHTAERDGIYMIWDGYVFRYDRCPADTVVLAPEGSGD